MNRWCDGLGRYGGTTALMLNGSSGQAWAAISSFFALSNANPRTGTWALRHTNDPGFREARRIFGANLEEVFLGMAVYCHSLPNTESNGIGLSGHGVDGVFLCGLRDATNGLQCRVLLGTDGALEVRRQFPADHTVLGRTAPIIGAGAYQHIEIYAKAGSASNGAIEIRVDEVTRLNLTGITNFYTDTPGMDPHFAQFAFGHELQGNPSAVYPTIDFADFYCNDTDDDGSGCNTFIGDCKSGVIMVDADTAQADWTKSSGSVGYSLINERPPNDATYIQTTASTAQSDFGLEDGPANLSEILTARPFVRAYKDDAGTCTLAPSMKSNGTKATVTAQPIATAAAYYDSNVPFDPDTDAPWDLAGLDAALEVVERTA